MPVDTAVTIQFSQEVDVFHADAFIIRRGNVVIPYTANPVFPASSVISVELVPNANLAYSTQYTVSVNNTLVTAAEEPDNFLAPQNPVTFTTAAAPAVTATNPDNNAEEVVLNSPITIEFSKAVNLTAGAVTITSPGGPVSFSGLPASDVTSVVLTPDANLAYDTTYTVTVLAAGVSDAEDNLMEADHSFSFSTVVPVPPVFNTPPSRFVTDGGSATLTVQVTSGTLPLTYRWYAGPVGDTSTPLREEGPTSAVSDSYISAPLAAPLTQTYWVRVVNDAGQFTDSDLITIIVTDKPFVDQTSPSSGASAVLVDSTITITFGEAVDLTAGAVTIIGPGGPVPFSGLPASGVTSVVLTPATDLADSTTYTVTVLAAEVSDADSNPMEADHVFTFTTLVPVEITAQPQPQTVPVGETATFEVGVSGDGPLHYDWLFNGTSLGAQDSAILTLDEVQPAQTGDYSVVVTGPGVGNTATSAPASLLVTSPPNQRPEWDFSGELPPGQVGLAYSFTPALLPDEPVNNIYRSAERFTASGLPAGLKINPSTGEIAGVPTAHRVKSFNVKITARNRAGSAVLTSSIVIQPLPVGVEGAFTGKVERSELLANVPNDSNGPLGGRIDFKVARTGKASGKLVIGAKSFAFRGAVAVDPLDTTQATLTAAIKRSRLTDLVLQLTITGDGLLDDATVSDQVALQPAGIEGWRNPWSKQNRADALAGYYTLKLELDGSYSVEEAPLGSGFLSFTLNPANGKLTLKGRLSDGSAVTMATFAGPSGQLLLYRPLYAAKVRGSVLGKFDISAQPDPLLNTVSGVADWRRPANPAKSNRLYRAGFPELLNLLAEGGRYTAPPRRNAANPTAEPRVLGLTDADNLVEVLFSEANVETAELLATVEGMKGEVALNNKVTFSKDFAINTRRATLRFNARTGAFNASIRLSEPNPLLLPDRVVNVNRTVKAQGLIVGDKAEGYFILNQLPAVAGETPGNTRQLGGKVLVQPVPPSLPD